MPCSLLISLPPKQDAASSHPGVVTYVVLHSSCPVMPLGASLRVAHAGGSGHAQARRAQPVLASLAEALQLAVSTGVSLHPYSH